MSRVELRGAPLTGAHLRAARALLRLKGSQLAAAAGVGLMSVKRAEASDFGTGLQADTEAKLVHALEQLGIGFFFADADGAVGVRLQHATPIIEAERLRVASL